MDSERLRQITIDFYRAVLDESAERLKELSEQKIEIEESMAKLDIRIQRALKYLEKAEVNDEEIKRNE